eukprot:1639108-Ditylum_brightwellii.AAC.1
MGCKRGKQRDLFVTRIPCMEPADGWRLPVVWEKPAKMHQDDWEWMNNLGFGGIIFANPKVGTKPLPEIIAN